MSIFEEYRTFNLGPVVQNPTKLLGKVMLKFLSWNMTNIFVQKNVSNISLQKKKKGLKFHSDYMGD